MKWLGIQYKCIYDADVLLQKQKPEGVTKIVYNKQYKQSLCDSDTKLKESQKAEEFVKQHRLGDLVKQLDNDVSIKDFIDYINKKYNLVHFSFIDLEDMISVVWKGATQVRL